MSQGISLRQVNGSRSQVLTLEYNKEFFLQEIHLNPNTTYNHEKDDACFDT